MSQMKLDQLKFQEIVRYLVQVDKSKTFEDICHDLSINKSQLASIIEFLKESKEDLDSRPELSKAGLEFDLLDWIQYQVSNPFQSFEIGHIPNDVEGSIEKAMALGHAINMSLFGRAYYVYPHQLVYLDGELSLICEGVVEKCLLSFPFNEISSMEISDEKMQPHFNFYDVSAFIQKMRSVDEQEERLVLKILDPKRFKTENFKEFFANPCLILTPRGESIWAATVEKSENLYDWLYQMFDFIEIVDPTSLKKEFFDYCQKKYKQHA